MYLLSYKVTRALKLQGGHCFPLEIEFRLLGFEVKMPIV